MTPPALPPALPAGAGTGRLPPSGAGRGVRGREEPRQRQKLQDYLQAGIFGRRQMLAPQAAAPFEAVAASSCFLLPHSHPLGAIPNRPRPK